MADTPFARTESGRYDPAGLSSKEFSRVFDQIDKDRRRSRRIARRTLNPLTLKNKALDDIIALGKKKSGIFYTKEDLKGFEQNRAGARQQFNAATAGITYAQLVAGSQQIDIKRANNRVDDGSGIKRATPTTLKHNVLTVSVEAFTAMRNWLSHEQDMMRLRTMAFHTVYGSKFDVALPEGQTYESWVTLLKHAVTQLSTDMVNRTRKAGIRGGFAGGEAANFLKSLPANVFLADPNFVQSPYIQRIGTLFGTYPIYEVPTAICDQFVANGVALSKEDILFYGRGDSIGDAGLIAGDAVPAIPYVHETNPSLVNRATLWGSSLNELHPRNGENYFTLTNAKTGAYNMLTGEKIQGETAPETATTGTAANPL